MLTLDQLGTKVDQAEKRIPISSLPFQITLPGSYYLTKSFMFAGTDHGITISSSDVVLDLNGFSISGSNTTVVTAGVRLNGNSTTPLRNVVVRNGTIDGFYYGVYFFFARNCVVYDVACASQRGIGMIIQNSSGNVLQHVSISNTALNGLDLTGTADDNHIADTSVTATQARGIEFLANGNGNLFERCVVSSNAKEGLHWTGAGSGNVVRNCSFIGNGLDGIYLSNAGLTGNRVDSNDSSKNGGAGIETIGTSKNVIVRNVFSLNTNANVFAATDVIGFMITTLGTFTSDQPWANFSY